jgi:hypothetical protein
MKCIKKLEEGQLNGVNEALQKAFPQLLGKLD